MTRFRTVLLLFVSTCLFLQDSSALAQSEKDAKREIAFGIDVARRGLWQEARFRFQKAVLQNPESASAYNNLAVALEQQGEFDLARAAYERALELKPGDLSIQQNYDLFREADEKRNRTASREAPPEAASSPEPPETDEAETEGVQ